MNRNELVDQCKQLIAEAYQEATEMIVAYLEMHPGEQLQSLCKEIDPENWEALRARVRRLAEIRKSEADSVRPHRAPTRSNSRVARATMASSDLSPEHKASIVAEADTATKKAILERLANDDDVRGDPEVVKRATSRLRGGSHLPKPQAPKRTLSERWRQWLNDLNGVLMDGARLAEATEDEGASADVYGELGYVIYQRITERKLDVELRELLDNNEARS